MIFGIAMIITPKNVLAQQEDQNSLIGTYAQGYDNGKLDAQHAFNSSGHYNSTCMSGHSATYCLGYYTGYNWQWAKLKVLNWWGPVNSK
jgi:hypothetical protein